MTLEEAKEAAAAIQHDIWSHWMRWFFWNDTPENRKRWRRQMETPFAELSEREKQSDRNVVSKFMGPVLAALEQAQAESRAALESVLLAERERDEAKGDARTFERLATKECDRADTAEAREAKLREALLRYVDDDDSCEYGGREECPGTPTFAPCRLHQARFALAEPAPAKECPTCSKPLTPYGLGLRCTICDGPYFAPAPAIEPEEE